MTDPDQERRAIGYRATEGAGHQNASSRAGEAATIISNVLDAVAKR
jgi:hypothetical protein